MDEIRQKRKKKKSRKRKIIVILVIILVLIGLVFLINRLIPIKNVTDDNIFVKLSTIKPTGRDVLTTVTTKTKYDIYYYIDYSAGEEQYYEEEEILEEATEENTSNTTSNTSNTNIVENSTNSVNSFDETEKKLDIKEIKNKQYKKVKDSKFEIENNGIVYLKYGRFGKLSSVPYVFEVANIDKDGPEIDEISTSTTYTTITVTANATDKNQSNLQYYFKLSTSGNYISTGSTNSYTFKDLTTDENYIIQIKVTDKFGNESEAVTDATATVQDEQEETVVKKLYHFKVNLGANTVTVYEKDEDGKFTKPIKSFICSTGKSTPKSGTYKISVRYRWRSLFGGVYGQYAVRIKGNILFHSVPYKKMAPNTLEYEEYDKLGTSASAGCVRLCVRDAKWIYDNAKNGSTVEFYSNSSNPGPLGKPKSQKISSNKTKRNWDPTDPDKHNPWLGGDGKVTSSSYTDYEDDDDEDIVVKKNNNTVTNTSTSITTNTSVNNQSSSNTTSSDNYNDGDSNDSNENTTVIDENSNPNQNGQDSTPPEVTNEVVSPPQDGSGDSDNNKPDKENQPTNTTTQEPQEPTPPETSEDPSPSENTVEN